MRLLAKFDDQKKGHTLSSFLTKEGIENRVDLLSNTDWGSPGYGQMGCSIWIVDEDAFAQAQTVLNKFLENPQDPVFAQTPHPIKPPIATFLQAEKKISEKKDLPKEAMGRLTTYLLVLCTLMLFIGSFSASIWEKGPSEKLPLSPFYLSTIYKDLYFDYPHAYEILDKIANAYGLKSLENIAEAPAEERVLLAKFYQTPYWQGFYNIFLQAHQNQTAMDFSAPMFEKARQGEIWRLLTPCFLHGDILHLVFNMLWLALLGRQMEHRLGTSRYAVFIIVVGVLSNILQYLMSGPDFLGISGIICGMIAFIWVRRRKAPWEGYQLQPGTLGFVAFFILLMCGIQLGSFIAQYYYNYPFTPGIANTAHLAGAFLGYVLGKTPFFSWKIT